MAIVVTETRQDLARLEDRLGVVHARLARAEPTPAASRELMPRVNQLLVDVARHLRLADEHLTQALAETNHESFLEAQRAVASARHGVQELEGILPVPPLPDVPPAG